MIKYLNEETLKSLILVDDEYQLEPNSNYMIIGQLELGSKALRLSENTLVRGLSDGVIISANERSVIRSSQSNDCNIVLREFNIVAPFAKHAIELIGEGQKNHVNLFFVGLYSKGGVFLDGFDVQAVNNCFFQCQENSITCTGHTNKIFINASPFYGDNEKGAIIFDKDLYAKVIDITSCFFKFDGSYCFVAEEGYKTLQGRLRGNLIDGYAKPLKGLYPQDIEWWMSDNTGIKNSNIVAEMHSVPGQDYKMVLNRRNSSPQKMSPLTLSGDRNERFKNHGDGSFTYINPHRPATLTIQGYIGFKDTMQRYSKYNIYLARNNELMLETMRVVKWDHPGVHFLEAILAEPNDTFSFWIEPASGTMTTSKKSIVELRQFDVIARG